MSNNERVRGVQVYRPIIYGSHARLLTEEEKEKAPPGHTHRWTVFLTSATSPPPDIPTSSHVGPPEVDMDYIPGGQDDLSYLIKKVTFRLHETYANPGRVFDKPPFKVTETGWGEFTVNIRIQFIPESGEKPMNLAHPIKLHHWGPPLDLPPPPPPAPASAPSENTGAGSQAGETAHDSTVAVTPTPTSSSVPPAASAPPPASASAAGEDVHMASASSAGPSAPLQSGAAAPVDITVSAPSTPPPAPAAAAPAVPATPISISTRYPVHSWQYDELVFSDPSQVFLGLMNEHPPTALPPRNRRAKDQREEHDRAKPSKRARQSAGGGGGQHARDGLASSLISGAGESGTGLGALQVGIPGEPGSADVPLEFSQEMEKGEWNRLNEARIRIVEEMDNWRERLIAQEKELARVKAEMKAVS